MNSIQSIFLLLLTLSLTGILYFVFIVWKSALARDGGAFPSASRLSRLGRMPSERSEISRWAAYLHRITGVGIFAFLSLHIVDVAFFAFSLNAYDSLHSIYSTLPMRIFECGLLFALLFHATNGFRLIIVDLFDIGVIRSNVILKSVFFLSIVGTIAGSYVILQPVIS